MIRRTDPMIYTARYNTLQTGKWRGLMDAAPRQLPVFADVRGLRFSADDADVIVLKSAADYEQASAGAEPVQMLGHSMQAVRLQGRTAHLSFLRRA
jgi:hypothetical protein